MEELPEDAWSPFKHLYKLIEGILVNPSARTTAELEINLKKYKQNFTTILRNPPKNERNRNQLRSGITDGITISGNSRTLLSKDLVDECIIISDMYDLDEFIALELLCTAQRQMPQHPGLPRGLVAILLYYDGRKAIASAIRDLFQITSGVSWITDLPKETTNVVSSFTQSIVDESNILERIISLLEELDFSKESMLLTKNRALGPKKHQNQVLELFEDTRLALATALFNWSAQRGLPTPIVIKLIQSLSKYKFTEPSGIMDDVTLTMLMALLYSYDTSVLQRQEDNNVFVQNLPILNDSEFAQEVYDELIQTNSNQNRLNSIAQFAFGLSLASLRRTPHNLLSSLSTVIERDEQLIDESISSKLFELMYYSILEKDLLYKTEFFYRRIHMLFTDFIDFMHSKVTELRGRADETARTVISFMKEGLDPPPNLDNSFEMLMLCIGKFYKGNRAGLSLCIEYWEPLSSANYAKPTTRSVSLFKFIRLAGELLPTTLFVPYLKMICGLTSCERSARNTFNLLKQASGLSGSTTLSWEHFFGSLNRYYTNLRQEHGPGNDTIYRNRAYNRNISPQEIEGLHAVLEVITAVATYDEMARIAICEHPNWNPLHVLIGLLGCSVPLFLKANILTTLAALAKSKESAITLWTNLEASQIISTLPNTNIYSTCNLEVEIEQNECRIESYPLSQGILDLLHSLVTTMVPKNLGGGPRKPGLDPYLTFIINGIFLKFCNRNYKNITEKWDVGEKCLKVFHYLLQSYKVLPQDFDENLDHNPPPGFHIMLQLHTKSDFLRLLLLIIDEATTKLDEYNKFQGKERIEDCALHCLNIIECGLAKQDLFFDAHSVANSSILLSGLNKIVLDVNPRSRRPDHVLNTTKFVTYSSWLPNHALVAVKILNLVCKLPNVAPQILGIFAQNNRIQNEIRQGFVECLENEVFVGSTNSQEDGRSQAGATVKTELQIKEVIIQLIQDCLPQPAPNISYFLLGFDASKDTYLNQRQRYGVIDVENNCFKSLVFLLDNHLKQLKYMESVNVDVERIAERSYYLLFSLCSNQRTSDTVLRYLRSYNDFLYRHVTALPFRNTKSSYVLNQMSHLLKCIAIELKVTSFNCQISRFQLLCEALLGTPGKNNPDTTAMELNHYYLHSTNTAAEMLLDKNPSEKTTNLLLCSLLDCLNFEMENHAIPKWEFFDNALMSQIFSDCEIKNEQGRKLINIKKLHEILNDELHIVQNTIASGHRKLILQEIESVLLFALKVNEERKQKFAIIKLMEALGQVIEILFSCAPESALPVATRQELILDMVQKILNKTVPIQPVFEISLLASGTILLLLVNLRSHNRNEELKNDGDHDANTNSIMSSAHFKPDRNLNVSTAKSNTLSLKYILKHILEWIISSGVASQKLRINLYASLLNCLRILKRNNTEQSDKHSDFYVSRLDKTIDISNVGINESNQIRMSVEVFLSFGDKLMEIICHDGIAGHDICKMSALSCIEALLELELMPGIINFISNRGYLTHIIESLLNLDNDLCAVLCNTVENLKPLYIYESIMAMLLRLASSYIGTETLLSGKILKVLSSMRVFDMHPNIQGYSTISSDKNEFIPSLDDRYRQILFPALNLCNCITSTLGPDNHSATSQIIYFVLSHSDMIEMVLRTVTPFASLGLLQELSALTAVIARITSQEIFSENESYIDREIGVNLYRIQRLMLSTLNLFIISEDTFKEMLKSENIPYEPTEANRNLHVKYFLEIASNLSLYCRNVVANHSADHRANRILFAASVSELVLRSESPSNLKKVQSLSVVVKQLRGSVDYFNSQKSVIESLLRQRTSLPNISFDTGARSTHIELTRRLKEKQNELSLCTFITEQCLYLLWSHLDFYMGRVAVSRGVITSDRSYIKDSSLIITAEDLGTLKKNLVLIFNETFCKQLLSTAESQHEMDKGFNEALLRRIKALIQFVSAN